jgi:hypothetical protein
VDADNQAWVPPEPGAVRALSVALKPLDQARARKHDKDLSNRLTDQASGLLGHAVVTIIGRQNAGVLPNRGTPAREKFIGLAGAGDVEIATVILIRDHENASGDRAARRVRADPAARPGDPVNLANAMRAMALM